MISIIWIVMVMVWLVKLYLKYRNLIAMIEHGLNPTGRLTYYDLNKKGYLLMRSRKSRFPWQLQF